MSQVTVLCQDMLGVLKTPLTLSDGTVLPAGSSILMLPQTIANCVLTPDGNSLAAAWKSISRDGHAHIEIEELIAAAQTQSAYLLDRMIKLEAWAAKNGYKQETE